MLPNPACVVCGPDNPRGLQLRFRRLQDGAVAAQWTPTSDWEGFKGIIHGGIVSTVLDEAMSQAVSAQGWPALTCELRVRLRRHVAPGQTLEVRAWVVERQRRKILTEAALSNARGEEHAHAWATFLAVPDSE
ncbi:MAG: PaaI family thioesterase [Bryobacterales bacterium]|nr:PaaI family thioesterase [Bryobacteraceae bacterium]MDW8129067.1 PaaI family thioesterase [Bryobacterales bacterium]